MHVPRGLTSVAVVLVSSRSYRCLAQKGRCDRLPTTFFLSLGRNDFDSTMKVLKEKKIKFFKKPKEEPFGKHAIIQDPDGHLVSIAEIKEKSAEGFATELNLTDADRYGLAPNDPLFSPETLDVLYRKVIVKALKVTKASGAKGTTTYTIRSWGGNISLAHFAARETRAGVSAAPLGQRMVFAGAFMKAGGVTKGRIAKPGWNGQVFRRDGLTLFRRHGTPTIKLLDHSLAFVGYFELPVLEVPQGVSRR